MYRLLIATVLLFASSPALAHGGGTNADGCHTKKSTGDYHCHTLKHAQMLEVLQVLVRGILTIVQTSIRIPKHKAYMNLVCSKLASTCMIWIEMMMGLHVSRCSSVNRQYV